MGLVPDWRYSRILSSVVPIQSPSSPPDERGGLLFLTLLFILLHLQLTPAIQYQKQSHITPPRLNSPPESLQAPQAPHSQNVQDWNHRHHRRRRRYRTPVPCMQICTREREREQRRGARAHSSIYVVYKFHEFRASTCDFALDMGCTMAFPLLMDAQVSR